MSEPTEEQQHAPDEERPRSTWMIRTLSERELRSIRFWRLVKQGMSKEEASWLVGGRPYGTGPDWRPDQEAGKPDQPSEAA